MKSFAPLILALAAITAAAPAQDAPSLEARQNAGRPVPNGQCCVANTNLKQDSCKASNGQTGRCVPGGNNCGGALSCVAQSSLTCNAAVIERGKSLCRAKAPGGGLFDGANIIQNLSQAKVN
ncbi:hypothetical protein DL546_008988 [Coniochaeta pulveracea]|uniref:Uncharacterized protein n=1 Tax=Coniochaeta pulveracea TaxID=177199 RepID=A0A420YFI8_9PEZI|nr:hypothetical protein DL546_008988 [Coniochaeta pulveracea]